MVRIIVVRSKIDGQNSNWEKGGEMEEGASIYTSSANDKTAKILWLRC